MKELYIRNRNGQLEYHIVSCGEPYVKGSFNCSFKTHDIIAAEAKRTDKSLGYFFSGIGKNEAFCDDNMPKKGTLFPCRIVSLPEGEKTYRISPVITFTGLLVHSEFVPDFSRQTIGAKLNVSKKIIPERADALATYFSDICENISFNNYSCSFTLRTLCGDKNIAFETVEKELLGHAERFSGILARFISTLEKTPSPGEVLYCASAPEYIISTVKKDDFDRIVTSDPSLSLEFEKTFSVMPSKPAVSSAADFDRLFDTVPGLMKFPSCLGRTLYTKSGARVVYDKTEAMHVFDINSADSSLDALHVNLECCETVARAVSVRNLTGIIMCDFINMKSKEEERQVVDRMRELAALDYRPFKIHGFTSLKVLECSRFR